MTADLQTTADPARPGHYNLRLYVAGQTPKSLSAIANLKKICEEHLAGIYTIEVIDLLVSPQLAAGDQILAVPTLVRRLPPQSSGSLVVFQIPIACWWDSISFPALRRPDDVAGLAPTETYVLRLFVTGTTTRSQRAISNIRKSVTSICSGAAICRSWMSTSIQKRRATFRSWRLPPW